MKDRFCALILALLLLAANGQAATINLDTTNDENNTDGDCSLREAVASANGDTKVDGCTAGSGADTINMPAGTYGLTTTLSGNARQLYITSVVTINGAGAASTIVDAAGGSGGRIFEVLAGATLAIKDVTLRNGYSDDGGAIKSSGILTVTNCNFSGNLSSNRGGALSSLGQLTITNSTFDANGSFKVGGGIYIEGSATISNTTLSNNDASDGGGGIWNAGVLNLSSSTLSGNSSLTGGGIFNRSPGTLNVSNSTLSGNSAYNVSDSQGGGIYNNWKMTISHSTMTGNRASHGGGIHNTYDAIIYNSIIANSPSGGDCTGSSFFDWFNNIIEDDKGCFLRFPEPNADPMLGPLADNGGPTKTHALLSGSPAIDRANNTVCASAKVNKVDQRGMVRPLDGDGDGFADCDIGAYEYKRGLGGPPPGGVLRVPIDILFCSNPNEFSCEQNGVVPITIFGNENLDVDEINIASVRLCLASDPDQCISAIDAAFPVDRGNPQDDLGTNQCTNVGGVRQGNPDGFEDIDLLFQTQELDGIAALIGCPIRGIRKTSPGLIIKGELNNGTQFLSAPIDNIGIDRLVIIETSTRQRDVPPRSESRTQ